MNVSVRGGASDEELSAVLALLAGRQAEAAPTGYELWRRTRLQALRRGVDRSTGRNSRARTG
jgi:hypothetical protein